MYFYIMFHTLVMTDNNKNVILDFKGKSRIPDSNYEHITPAGILPNQLTLLIAGQIQLIFFLFNKPNMDRIKRCLKPYIGIGICALSSLFFCVCNVFVKHLKHVDPLLIGCFRLFAMALLSTPVTVLRFYEVELSTKVLTYLLG